MTLLISRLVLTSIALIFVYFIWTRNVNVFSWLINKIESTLPVESTEFAKQQFELLVDLGLDSVEEENFNQELLPWRKAKLRYRFHARITTEKWHEKAVTGIVFFSADRLYSESSNLPNWIANKIKIESIPEHYRVLHHTKETGEIQSASLSRTDWGEPAICIDHLPWKAAVYIAAKNSDPIWFQLSISNEIDLSPLPGQGVQVRELHLESTRSPQISIGRQALTTETK